jgi:hypothetical protein
MGRRQKGKGSKRRKSWHRGHPELERFDKAMRRLPDVKSGGDPTEGRPEPLRRDGGPSRLHYET